jgi:sulfatase maturation enzyme AslB (radical SAM superfamily)
MCVPKWSSLIEREWKELGWLDEDFTQNFNDFSMVQIDKAIKLYIAGGEPTAMPEFYTFLKKCIDEKHTGFEIQVNTNASKISNRLLGLTKNFSNFSFTVSIDGYQDANDYTRWGSQWHTVVDNIHRLQRNGHSINFNIVVSLLTIFSFHDLVRFLDSEFPGCLVHAQLADNITPFVIPYSKDQLAKIETIKQTSAYSANELFASFVDTLLNLCKKSTLDKSKLQHFFSRNDTIDISRDSCLNDYIPELEKLRELL